MFRFPNHDDIFQNLLEKEFLFELTLASRLMDRKTLNEEQRFLLGTLCKKYHPASACPSHLYHGVSRPLQREYDRIHRQMMRTLYRLPIS